MIFNLCHDCWMDEYEPDGARTLTVEEGPQPPCGVCGAPADCFMPDGWKPSVPVPKNADGTYGPLHVGSSVPGRRTP